MKSVDLRRSRARLRVAQGVLVASFLGLTARAVHLSLLDVRAAARGRAQVVSVLRLAPERGLIVDRQGVELAVSVPAPSVYALPHAITHPHRAALALAGALDADSRRLEHMLRSRSPFVYLARWVEAEQAHRVRALQLPGVGIVPEPRRAYPHGHSAAPLIGFTNIDARGVRGVEQSEDAWLRGRSRRVAVERDARGHLLMGPGVDPDQAIGGDVSLSIDATYQADAEAALEHAMHVTKAHGGFVVCLKPQTGEVLALAERPSFDPNRFRAVPYKQTRSRVFLDAMEPGSTLKPFLVAAALEAGSVALDEILDLGGGALRVPGRLIHDSHPHPDLDIAGILRVSSNVGAVRVVQRLGAQAYSDALHRFGFGTPTGSGFPDESAGLLRGWQSWKPLDQATAAFGQGLSVTPIQMAAAVAALANEGLWLPPQLVLARRRPGRPWVRTRRPAGRRAVSAQTAKQILRMLEGVVSPTGTGRRAALADVRVAGKTGTAQKLDPATGSYATNRYVAWFAGIAPAEAPKIAVVAGLDEPQGAHHTGGAVAAPLFARVAAAHLTRLGIATHPAPLPRRVDPPRPLPLRSARRGGDGSATAGRAASPKPAPRRASARRSTRERLVQVDGRTLLPDFRGLSVGEVRQITAGTPLVVELSGAGVAVGQEPAPGTILAGQAPRVRVRFTRPGGSG